MIGARRWFWATRACELRSARNPKRDCRAGGRPGRIPPSTPRNGFRSRRMLASLNRHLVQPLSARKAGSAHLKHLAALERTQFDPPEVVRDRQLDAVRQVVRHAWDTVPFYRDRWAAA